MKKRDSERNDSRRCEKYWNWADQASHEVFVCYMGPNMNEMVECCICRETNCQKWSKLHGLCWVPYRKASGTTWTEVICYFTIKLLPAKQGTWSCWTRSKIDSQGPLYANDRSDSWHEDVINWWDNRINLKRTGHNRRICPSWERTSFHDCNTLWNEQHSRLHACHTIKCGRHNNRKVQWAVYRSIQRKKWVGGHDSSSCMESAGFS